MHTGEIIKKIAEKQGMGQVKFARMLGISRTMLQIRYKDAEWPDFLLDKALKVLKVKKADLEKYQPKDVGPGMVAEIQAAYTTATKAKDELITSLQRTNLLQEEVIRSLIAEKK